MLRQPKLSGKASRCATGGRAKGFAMLREFRVGPVGGGNRLGLGPREGGQTRVQSPNPQRPNPQRPHPQPENCKACQCAPECVVGPVPMLRPTIWPGRASRCATGDRAKGFAMLCEFRVGPRGRWTGSGWAHGKVDGLGLGLGEGGQARVQSPYPQ